MWTKAARQSQPFTRKKKKKKKWNASWELKIAMKKIPTAIKNKANPNPLPYFKTLYASALNATSHAVAHRLPHSKERITPDTV